MPIIWENVGVTTRYETTKEQREGNDKIRERNKKKLNKRSEYAAKAREIAASIDQIKTALTEWDGSLHHAAKALGVERPVLLRKVQHTPALTYHLKNIMQEKVDIGEYELFQQVKSGVLPAIIMLLKTQGKDRGYTEKNGLEEVNVNVLDSAALIEAMRSGVKVVQPQQIESKDYKWEDQE